MKSYILKLTLLYNQAVFPDYPKAKTKIKISWEREELLWWNESYLIKAAIYPNNQLDIVNVWKRMFGPCKSWGSPSNFASHFNLSELINFDSQKNH